MKLIRIFSWIYLALSIIFGIVYLIHTVAWADFLIFLQCISVVIAVCLFIVSAAFVGVDIIEFYERKHLNE